MRDYSIFGEGKMMNEWTKCEKESPSFEEVSKQMRINADCIMKEISDHVDREIERFKQHLCEIKVPDAFTQPPLHDGLIDPGSKRLDEC